MQAVKSQGLKGEMRRDVESSQVLLVSCNLQNVGHIRAQSRREHCRRLREEHAKRQMSWVGGKGGTNVWPIEKEKNKDAYIQGSREMGPVKCASFRASERSWG